MQKASGKSRKAGTASKAGLIECAQTRRSLRIGFSTFFAQFAFKANRTVVGK
jgi:hypothetical protein